ncbi:hypothetical protein ACGFIF_37450 [Kribbella sp. NPDC049174]|uniref:hypothetical protein n=1 Tax=Kribbella sp. NPDC049174 TaxID=3364112 RepID=UPI00371BBF05
MTQYRLLIHREVLQQLAVLKRAAATQTPGGLRRRELEALELGLRALAHGQEELFAGKRLGFGKYDLSDCAEIKLPVIPEARRNHELGPSHRLLYREFEAEDGGLPYREIVAFEPRKNDRPFDVAAARLGRARGTRIQTLAGVAVTSHAAPIRQALPPDIRDAIAATSGVGRASGAVRPPEPAEQSRTHPRRDGPPGREF